MSFSAQLKDYASVFRPVRWYQNVLVVVGGVLCAELLGLPLHEHLLPLLAATVAACLVASGNYGLNEVLDAEQDSHHPQKRHRALPAGRLSKSSAVILSVLLYVLGFSLLAATGAYAALVVLAVFFVGALLYNVEPFRFKDRPYLDFIFEAINSPLRVLLGWYAVSSAIFPSSFILALWFLGIFLMAAKRFGDIRLIRDRAELESYRKSQKYYTEEKLLFSMIASLGVFYYMLGALAMKYSVDLIVTLPLVVIWTVWVFHLAYEDNTVIKDPERIFEKKGFLLFSLAMAAVFFALFVTKSQILSFFK